jgi:UDP-glucose:(heptosyl)LPS alpha-1,3-glucosyltransferase
MLSRPRKIALVIDRFDGRRGGASHWTRGFAQWLAACECDVHVLTRSVGPIEAGLPITIHTIDAPRSPLAFPRAVSQRLAAIHPILSHDMGAAIGCDIFQPHVGSVPACWEGSVASCPGWFQPVKRFCGLSPRYWRIRRLTSLQYSSSSRVFIALSQKVARDMKTFHGVPAERIRTIYNGIDLDRFSPWVHRSRRAALRRHFGIGVNEVLIVSLAHHFRLKGISVLIRAVKQLRSQGAPVKLLLCGGDRQSAHPKIDSGGAILRCGNVEDVAPLYATADICVHPTFYDACSLVTLEALASGLPVVTTYANGASELITSGVNGLVLEHPYDSDALARALLPLVGNSELRRDLGSAARRLMHMHSAERNYREIVAAYIHALSMRSIDSTAFEPLLLSADDNCRRRSDELKNSLIG